MSHDVREVDQNTVDQPLLFARMLQGVALMGEVQTTIARALVDAHMDADHKVVMSSNLAIAINALNRASHILMRASLIEAGSESCDFLRRDVSQPH